jgi:hypothetical protein
LLLPPFVHNAGSDRSNAAVRELNFDLDYIDVNCATERKNLQTA